MIQNIAYSLLLGKPLIMYGGIFTFILMLSTAIIAILNSKGIRIIPFKCHHRLAIVTIIFATIHAIFGLSFYFNF